MKDCKRRNNRSEGESNKCARITNDLDQHVNAAQMADVSLYVVLKTSLKVVSS